MRSVSDRTAKARIRDAAIACIAERGVGDTTVRMIAERAGVSPGLVIHHFGSMEGLRSVCDEHVAGTIRELKHGAVAQGTGFDLLASLRESGIGSLTGYLARVLVEDSPAVERLVDEMVRDAEEYGRRGVAEGVLRPSDDPRGRAVILALWSLGALVLHRHLERLLGADLTDPQVGEDPAIARYLAPAYEALGTGIFTDEAASRLRAAVASLSADDDTTRGTT
jgi:AcrR family transcriptional regulator